MATSKVAHSKIAARAIFAALAMSCSVAAVAAPTLKAMQTGSAHLQLGTAPYELTLAASKSSVAARAVNMVSADLNIDGFADLISGYAQAKGGFITVHRGNKEAYSPTSAAAFANLKLGIYPPGFLSESQITNLPVAPELLVAGDFNADGDPDLVFAKRGDSAIYFLPGSRAGFGTAQKMALNGTVDAIAAGEIDLPNGSLDLAVAVSAQSGASLKIYRDGIANEPLDYAVPASVTQLAIGNLDDSPMGDVAILAGGRVSILHGYNHRESVPVFSRLEALEVGAAIQSFALGNFIWDREGKTELALLGADGALAIAARGALNTTPFSVAEVRAKRREQIAAKSVALKYWQPGSGGVFAIRESNADVVSKAMAMRGATLLRANLAGQMADDLIVVDSLSQTLKLLTVEGTQRKSYSISATSAPVAAIAIPTSNFVLPSLIVLGEGAAGPSVLPSVPKAVFTVNKTADTNDGTCNVDCSLREAIVAANLAAGADSITVPAGTYTLTIANTGGVNEDLSAQGDLDITGPLAITGAGLATTIIQGGTTNANGIDKVLAFSPFCTALNMSLSDVTVRFGRNSQLATNPDFSYTGGGIDVCNGGAGTFAMSNVLVDQNTNLNGYGGGVNFDSLQPANGSYSITGSTISGNRTTSAAAVVKNGGGINLFADQHGVTITNTAITGNISAAEGGGVYARHTFGGAILIQGSTINSNTAASRGGGVSNSNLGVSTLTLNNDGFVQNNISQGTVAGTESRGGGIFLAAQNTSSSTVNEMNITGNIANTGTFQGGGGVATVTAAPLTLTFNRIAGNTAGTAGGAGLHNAGAPITGTRNWWGCNAGPTVAPCDLAVTTSGTSTLTPRLQLAHAASPSTILIGLSTTLTANFLTDSGSVPVAPANLDAIIGTPIAFSGAVLGTLSAAQTTIQANGTATATFTATGGGAGSANSVVDAQSQTASITITVPTASIAVLPASVSEDGATNLVYTVTLSQVVSIPTSVNFTIAGTANSGSDYAAITSPLVIPANTLTGTITIDPTVDGTVEADETAILTLATGPGYTVGTPTSAIGTILNDDVPSVSIAVLPVSVLEDGVANLVYTVTLNQAALSPTSVNFTVAGTATSGTDYAAVASPLIIFTGNTTGTITVNPAADTTFESDETVILTVTAGTGYTVGAPASATGTILNDDVPNLTINDVTASEGNAGTTSFTFSASLSAPAGPGGVTFDIATANGTAVAPGDYVAQSLTGQTIPSGNSTYTFTVLVNGDSLNEPNETFFVNVSNVTGATVVDGQGQGTITNDDALPSLSIDNISVTEGNAGTVNAVFTVSLSAASGQTVSVNFVTADGTATQPSDYVSATGSVTFTPGQTTRPIAVVVNGDTAPEANETFTVGLSSPSNAVITGATGTGTILNDDSPVASIAVAPGSVLEDGVANLVYTVSLSVPALSPTTVALTTTGTAVTGVDYSGAIAFVSIGTGASSGTITIDPSADTVIELDETVILTLAAGSGYTVGSPNSATGTITNDDFPAVSIAVLPASVAEDGATNLLYTVSLNQAALSATTVNIGTAGTAISGSDYTGGVATLNIPTGSLSGTITIDPTADAVVETNETVILNVAAGTDYTVGAPNSATGTITNDDTAGITLTPSGGTTDVTEGGATDTYTLVLTAQPSSDVTVSLLPAQVGVSAPSLVFTNSNWNVAQTVTVNALDDAIVEGAHAGSISHSSSSSDPSFNGLSIGTLAVAITDNDSATYQFTQAANALIEGASGSVTVSLAFSPGASSLAAAITVPVALSGSATGGGIDYSTSASSVTIALNGASQSIDVTTVDDALSEGNETIVFTLGDESGGSVGQQAAVLIGSPAATTVNIQDNDLAISPSTLPAGQAAVAYSQALSTSGGNGSYTYLISAGALGAGLSLSPAGVISGTPTAVGTFNFTVTVTDGLSSTGTQVFTLTIAAPNLSFTPVTLPNPVNSTPYNQQLTPAGGNAAYVFSISAGGLPSGIALSPAGLISGTTTASGIVGFTVRLCDASTGPNAPYCTTRAYTLILNTPPVANEDGYTILEDQVLSVTAPGVLGNDTDIDPGTTLTVNPAVSTPITPISGNVAGTVAISANGQLAYTPTANSNGQGTVSYFAFDGNVPSASAGVVTINVTPVNDAPSFATTGDRAEVAGASGARSVSGFISAVSVGPSNEASQVIQAYLLSEDSDPANIVSSVAISTAGVLSYTLADVPTGGSATIRVQAQDNGGTANGGVDLSAAQTFRIVLQGGSDLGIVLYNGRDLHNGGGLVNYVVVVRNAGPIAINGARVQTQLASVISPAGWTCTPSGGATCTASGTGSIDQLVNLPVEGVVRFDLTSTLALTPEGSFVSQAQVTAPSPLGDRNPADNQATDADRSGIFANGFEQAIFVEGIDASPEEINLSTQTRGPHSQTLKIPALNLDGDRQLPFRLLRLIDSKTASEGLVEARQNNQTIELRASLKRNQQWQIGTWTQANRATWELGANGELLRVGLE